jgi:hypothetical protein
MADNKKQISKKGNSGRESGRDGGNQGRSSNR